jgi:hypothetical protein
MEDVVFILDLLSLKYCLDIQQGVKPLVQSLRKRYKMREVRIDKTTKVESDKENVRDINAE